MHEAILEDGLGDHSCAFGHGIQRHELRLHVGGKARIRRGAQTDAAWSPRHVKTDAAGIGFDVGASLTQLVQHCLQQGGIGAL